MSEKIDWKAYLKPEEIVRLDEIEKAHGELVQERKRIYQRCRKRAIRAMELADAAAQ